MGEKEDWVIVDAPSSLGRVNSFDSWPSSSEEAGQQGLLSSPAGEGGARDALATEVDCERAELGGAPKFVDVVGLILPHLSVTDLLSVEQVCYRTQLA